MHFTEDFLREYERRRSGASGTSVSFHSGSRYSNGGLIRVLGVDTSLRSTGIGVVECVGNDLVLVKCGTIRCQRYMTLSECLKKLAGGINDVVDECRPDEVAVEGIFCCRNPKTAIILGHARGVVLQVCASRGLPVYEYTPRRVKLAVTGVGTAVKVQMQRMVASSLRMDEIPQNDAADALAIAITHVHARTGPGLGTRI